ncbi:MAG: FtsK/SpoIIIE domain-containing protein [Microbacteriaceae bacterium]
MSTPQMKLRVSCCSRVERDVLLSVAAGATIAELGRAVQESCPVCSPTLKTEPMGEHSKRYGFRSPGAEFFQNVDGREPLFETSVASGADFRIQSVREISSGTTREHPVLDNRAEQSRPGGPSGRSIQRSIQLIPQPQQPKLTFPEIPAAPQHSRIPVIAMFGSMLIGGASFMLTGSPLSLVFILLGPLIATMQGVAGRIPSEWILRVFLPKRADAARQIRQDFRDALSTETQVESLLWQQQYPGMLELLRAFRSSKPLLWQRTTEQHGTEIALRLGRADRMSPVVALIREQYQNLLNEASWTPKLLSALKKKPRLLDYIETCLEEHAVTAGQPRELLLSLGKQYGCVLPTNEEFDLIDRLEAFDGDGFVNAMIIQLALLYSPSLLNVRVRERPERDDGSLISQQSLQPQASRQRFGWVPWLPHWQADAHSQTKTAISRNSQKTRNIAAPLQVQFVIDPSEEFRAQILAELEHEPEVITIWVVAESRALPPDCEQFIEYSATRATLITPNGTESVFLEALEHLDARSATMFARELSACFDADTPQLALPEHRSVQSVSGSPHADLDNQDHSESDRIRRAWMSNTSQESLEVIIGEGNQGPVAINLISDGPHALIAGTTGSGKSDFLQNWVLALARSYSPAQINFLFIDFKGGATFQPLTRLPHHIGSVSDLSEHGVSRVFISLLAELKRRERILLDASCNNIEGYRRRTIHEQGGEPLPRLLIVIDEFAALLGEHPEYSEIFVNLAQRGRSLGMHLILSTQRPSGVVPASLAANLGLRIAFRTTDVVESQLLIDSDAASLIPREAPGRAIIRRSQLNQEEVQMWSLMVRPELRSRVRIVQEFFCTSMNAHLDVRT